MDTVQPQGQLRKDAVASVYGQIARLPAHPTPTASTSKASSWGYSNHDVAIVPTTADLGLSCGNPLANAPLKTGDVVLDLGSGGGFDSFVAAHKVGPEGHVIGVDLSPEMVERARANAVATGFRNAEFRTGDIEALPVASDSIDVATSNCVLNLVPDKFQAFREIARVLKPGGCFVASDTVLLKDLPDWAAQSESLYACCVAGAVSKDEYLHLLREAGFVDAEILSEQDVTGLFARDDASAATLSSCCDLKEVEDGSVASVSVRAFKPNPGDFPATRQASAKRPLLIVLGLSDRILPIATRLGIDVVFLGPQRSRAPANARFYEVRLEDEEAVSRIVEQLKARQEIAGVLTLEGYFLQAAATLSVRLKLSTAPSSETGFCGEDKFLARRQLQQAGVPGPRFAVADSVERARAAAEVIGYPLVAKPLNDSNSRLVTFCADPESLAQAVSAILSARTNLVGQPLEPAALLESYVDGTEYSAEVVVDALGARTVALCEKLVGPPPYFIEVGHTVPARVPPDVDARLRTTAEAAVRAVGRTRCVAHVELRISGDDVFVIEVNLRPVGGRLPELIATVTGWDVHEAAVAIALGRPAAAPATAQAAIGVYHCLTVDSPARVLYERTDIVLACDAPAPFVEIDVPPGELVYPVNDPRGRIFGRILAYGQTVAEASSIIDQVKEGLNLRYETAGSSPSETSAGSSGCWSKGCC